MSKKEMLETISEFLNENIIYGKCDVKSFDLDVEKEYNTDGCETSLTIRINTKEAR